MADKQIWVDFDNKTTLVADDSLTIADSEASNSTKDTTVGAVKDFVEAWDTSFDTDTLHINSTNNRVWVGTISPWEKLEIYAPTYPFLMFQNASTTNWFRVWYEANSYALIDNLENAPIVFRTNAWAERMRIDAGGNIWIGTTSPWSKLSVVWLPTSSSWLSAWDIWNDSGTLKIV